MLPPWSLPKSASASIASNDEPPSEKCFHTRAIVRTLIQLPRENMARTGVHGRPAESQRGMVGNRAAHTSGTAAASQPASGRHGIGMTFAPAVLKFKAMQCSHCCHRRLETSQEAPVDRWGFVFSGVPSRGTTVLPTPPFWVRHISVYDSAAPAV